MARRWIVKIEDGPNNCPLYLKLEDKRPVTVSYATLFVTKKEAIASAESRGLDISKLEITRTWW